MIETSSSVFVISNDEEPFYIFGDFNSAKYIAEKKNLIWIDEIKFEIEEKSVVNTWKFVNDKWTSNSNEWDK